MNINEYAQIVADQKEELKLINSEDLCSRKEEKLFDIELLKKRIIRYKLYLS